MPPYCCGLPLGGDSPPLFDADFTVLTPGALTDSALFGKYGLHFARAIARLQNEPTFDISGWSETVQTSDRLAVTAGLVTDVARVGQRSSSQSDRGILLEERRENNDIGNRGFAVPPKTAGTAPTAGSYTAVDGATLTLNRFILTSSQFSNYMNMGNQVLRPAYTVWLRSGASVGTTNWQIGVGDGTSATRAVGGTIDQTWSRKELLYDQTPFSISAAACDGRAFTGGPAAGNRDTVCDLMQLEHCGHSPTTTFSTETILTQGAVNTNGHAATLGNSVQRQGERLWHPNIAPLIIAGRLSVMFSFIVKGNSTDQYRRNYSAFVARILTLDATNYAEWDATTHKINVRVAGSTWTPTPTFTFNKVDRIDLWLRMGSASQNSTLKIRVNGSVTDFGNSGSAQGALSGFTIMDLLCSRFDDPNDIGGAVAHPSQQFSSWLNRMTIYDDTKSQRPSWG